MRHRSTDALGRFLDRRRQVDHVHAHEDWWLRGCLRGATVAGLPALLEKLRLKPGLSVSNLIVSNPFGLTEPRFLMGATVELVLPISVVAAGQMLNVTAVTLGNQLQVGFLGIPSAVPGIDRLADHMVRAFAELKQAAMTPKTAQAPAKRIRAPRPAARRRAA